MSFPITPSRFILCALLTIIVILSFLGPLMGNTAGMPNGAGPNDGLSPGAGYFENGFDGERVDPIDPLPVAGDYRGSAIF